MTGHILYYEIARVEADATKKMSGKKEKKCGFVPRVPSMKADNTTSQYTPHVLSTKHSFPVQVPTSLLISPK